MRHEHLKPWALSRQDTARLLLGACNRTFTLRSVVHVHISNRPCHKFHPLIPILRLWITNTRAVVNPSICPPSQWLSSPCPCVVCVGLLERAGDHPPQLSHHVRERCKAHHAREHCARAGARRQGQGRWAQGSCRPLLGCWHSSSLQGLPSLTKAAGASEDPGLRQAAQRAGGPGSGATAHTAKPSPCEVRSDARSVGGAYQQQLHLAALSRCRPTAQEQGRSCLLLETRMLACAEFKDWPLPSPRAQVQHTQTCCVRLCTPLECTLHLVQHAGRAMCTCLRE